MELGSSGGLMRNDSRKVWASLDNPSASTLASVGGLHNLVSLPDYAIAAFSRDFVCVGEHDGTNRLGATFQTPFGRRLVKPMDYMDVINAMQPDIWASLPDEAPSWVTSKRTKQSVERTLDWLDCCLGLKQKDANIGLGCIVGGASQEDRIFSAQETAKRDVSGFSICGFGLGESAEDRGLLLEAIMANLPDEKPRHISGLGMPEEVLQAVSAGIDVFDSTYPHILTMSGLAMVFPLKMATSFSNTAMENGNTDIGSDFTKINLRALSYRNDTSPILENCKCYTCMKHSKAYINHLLNTHEMLAQTLLDIHNTHHYLNFFGVIRDSIQGGYFTKFKDWFVSRRRVTNEAILMSCHA
ncbi:hypothetical protein L7F22_028929 [Adiantum nelumboides]|nr:hypothetical protein [Adiantum nelumboides]